MNRQISRLWWMGLVLLGAVIALSACGPGTETPTPTPTGTPGPTPTPAPVITYHASDFGVTWSSGYYKDQYTNNPPQQWAADTGATWDRWDFHWNWVMETRPGVMPPVWAGQRPGEAVYSYEKAVNGDKRTTPPLNILAVLNGGLLPDDQIGLDPFGESGTWPAFVEAVREEYGSKIAAWELGNETGFVHEAPGGLPPLTPDEYAQALRTTCNVLGQDSTIILGSPVAQVGLSLANYGHGYQEHREFAARGWETYRDIIFKIKENSDLQNCVDAIGVHAYLRVPLSYWITTGLDAYARSAPFVWSDPHFWITESGLAVGHEGVPCVSAEQGSNCESEEVQANYVIQQYAVARQAGVAVVLHHRLRDDSVGDGTYGLLHEPDNHPWPSFYAAWLTTQLLGDSTFEREESGDGYKHLIFTGRNGEVIHVLWTIATQDVSVSFEPDTSQNARFYYQVEAQSYFEGHKPDPQPVDPDSGMFRVTLFGTDSGFGGGGDDPYYYQDTEGLGWDSSHYVGGETVIVVETSDTASPPTGSASLVCMNNQPKGVDFMIDDGGAGYATLSAIASPLRTYDLARWTEPGRVYYGTIWEVPAVGTTATITLTNRAGLSVVRTLHNPGPSYCAINPPDPGNDHPDDNASAADAPIPSGQFLALPAGARMPPRVAILNRGAAHGLWWLLAQLGEPAEYVGSDFDPLATAAQYPVLLIPSGGLYGLEGSASFRARLEEYARQGGTIVAFAQQHGYEYAALPGGEVNGYGWNEDISCFQAALRMESWHPLLAGFNRDTLTVHVDGYFAPTAGGHWPAGAQVLLSRTANSQPGALLYPFGAGHVLATTIYDDWGTLNGQASADARTLLRDLLAWAIPSAAEEMAGELALYAPGDTVMLTLPITNSAAYPVTAVALRLVNPARQVVLTRTVAITIPAGSAATIPFTTAVARPLGIYRLDVQLLAGVRSPISGLQQIARFVVARPPAIVDPTAPLYLSITGPAHSFFTGSFATFNYHLYNRSTIPLTATVSYGFDHWGHSQYSLLAKDVVVPAAQGNIHGETILPLDLSINRDFRLRGYAVSGAYRVYASYGVRDRRSREVGVTATLQPAEVQRGAETTLTLQVSNLTGLPLTPTLHIQAFDAARTLYHTATLTVAVPAQGAGTWPGWPTMTYPLTIPVTAVGGTGQVWVEAYTADGNIIGGAVAALHIPSSPLVFTLGQPGLAGDARLAVPLTLTHTAASLPIATGALTLTLATPDALVIATAATTFTLPPLTSQTLTLPLDLPPLAFGAYTLTATVSDEYGVPRQQDIRWDTVPRATGALDYPTYRAGETAYLSLTLDNASPFQLPLTVTLTAPALAYTSDQTFTLEPRAADTWSWSIPVPPDVTAGSYPLYVSATLPSGSVWGTPVGAFVVPPARLQWADDAPTAATAGDTLELFLYNSGGVDAEAAVSLRLLDARGLIVAAWAEPLVLPPGDTQSCALTVPDQARSGTYTLLARAALPGAEPLSLWRLIQIDGVTAGLTAVTDAERYSLWDSLTAAATIANGPRPLHDAQLHLEIVQAAERLIPAWESCLYEDPDCGLSGYFDNVNSVIAIDAGGNRWFGATTMPEGYNNALDRLAADGVTWQSFVLPIGQKLNDLAVGPDGRVWLAFSSNDYGPAIGAAVLQPDTEAWLTYSSADSGLGSDNVVRVVPDAAGNVWFATAPAWDNDLGDYRDGGLSVLRADATWITYTTANSGLLTESPTALAVDTAGNVWVAGDGLSQLRPDGVWITYTVANSALLTDTLTDVVVASTGDVWAAAGAGLSRLHAGDWITYTPANSGLRSDQLDHVVADVGGRIWTDVNNNRVQVYDPATDVGALYALPGEMFYAWVQDLAVGSAPDEVWVATSRGVARYRPPVTTRVLWQTPFPVNLASVAHKKVQTTLGTLYILDATGKLYLQARLLAATGQELATAGRPFYVEPENVVGCSMTINLTPTVARPAQPLHVAGEILSRDADYENVHLAVTLDGETILVSDALTLPQGIPVSYTLTLPAPDREGAFLVTTELRLDGEGDPILVSERLEVGLPRLQAVLEAPPVAGRAPFSVALTLENPTPLALHLTLTRDGAPPENLTLPAGERALRLWSQRITTATVLGVALSGDVSQVLTRSVAFGESLATTWLPEAYYPPGRVAVPYIFTNTGQLDLTFSTYVTLTGEAEEIAATEFARVLLAGNTSAGQVVFADISPGDYTFAVATPWSADAFSLTVRPAEAAALDVVAEPAVGSAVTVTALVTNTGGAPLEAVLHVPAPFDTLTPVLLAPAEALTLPLIWDVAALAPGVWPLTLTVETGGGAVLATAGVTLTVPGSDLVLTAVPTDTLVRAGAPVTLTFGVANRGSAPATAVLTVTVGDFVDEVRSLWLPGGAANVLDFTFRAPDGLAGNGLLCTYAFMGERRDFVLNVAGVDLDVAAGWDAPLYTPGVTATLRLTVTNHSPAATPPLYAHVAYAGTTLTQPLTLAGGATQALDFSLTAGDYTGDTLVFYAVYEADEQRGIHLNTTYLRLRQPGVTVIPDRTVYRPGDTVHAAVVTTATGTLTVTAPGLPPASYPLPSTPSIQFTLPATLQRGTYTLNYALTLPTGGEESAWGSAPFDVDAPWVRITAADLLEPRPTPGETLRAELTVASTDALTVAVRSWLRYPDGTRSAEVTQTAPLAAALNNHLAVTHPFSTTQAGSHRLVSMLTAPDDPEYIYAVSVEHFDVGTVVILGLHTAREAYPGALDPVTATLTLYATSATQAELSLLLDGELVAAETPTLTTGVSTLTVALPGPIAPGRRTLTARITADGRRHAVETAFAYGSAVVDLVAGTPQLLAGSGPTRTLRLWAYNRGATDSITTTFQVWDGDPDAGGTLLGDLPLPPLAPGAGHRGELPWNVLGQAGTHALTSVVDPDALVAEFYEDNNRAAAVVTLPPFDVRLVASTTSCVVGEPVSLTVWATNLAAVPATLALTTTAGAGVFTDVRTLAVPAAAQASAIITWDTTGLPGGHYTLRTQSANQEGAAAQALASVYLVAALTPPQVDLGPERSVAEGSPLTFTATITDPDTPTGHTLHWDFGDGGTAGGTLTPTHVYADDGVYPVTLTVTNTGGLSGAGHLTVTVLNAAPIVRVGPESIAMAGEAVTFTGSFTDPGVLDVHTLLWDFGDGATADGALSPTHVYTAAGAYTITLTVTDDDGGVGSAATRAVIRPPLAAFAIEYAAIQWGRDTGDPAAFTLIGQLELPDGYTNADLERSLTLTLQIGAGSVSQTVALRQIGRDVWLFYGEFDPAAEGLQWGEVMIVWQGPGAAQAAHCLLQGLLTIPGVDHNTRPAAATVNLQFPLVEDGAPGWLAGTASPAFRTYRRLWWYEPR